MKTRSSLLASTLLTLLILFPRADYGMQAATPAPASDKATTNQRSTATAPSTQEIADAKSKGLVWVNLTTHVYHKDGSFYGATKHGKFMTEDEATKAGYRAAKEPASKKAAPAK